MQKTGIPAPHCLGTAHHATPLAADDHSGQHPLNSLRQCWETARPVEPLHPALAPAHYALLRCSAPVQIT